MKDFSKEKRLDRGHLRRTTDRGPRGRLQIRQNWINRRKGRRRGSSSRRQYFPLRRNHRLLGRSPWIKYKLYYNHIEIQEQLTTLKYNLNSNPIEIQNKSQPANNSQSYNRPEILEVNSLSWNPIEIQKLLNLNSNLVEIQKLKIQNKPKPKIMTPAPPPTNRTTEPTTSQASIRINLNHQNHMIDG